jgi:membrane protein
LQSQSTPVPFCILCDDTRTMAEYRRLKGLVWPYIEELFSNEIYVFVSAIAMNALFSFTPFVILIASVWQAFVPKPEDSQIIYDILGQYLPFMKGPSPPTGKPDLDFVIINLRAIAQGFGKAQIVSTVVLIWSVASVFIPLEMTLNRALGVKESRGFWGSQWLAVKMIVVLACITLAFVSGAYTTRSVIGAIVPVSWGTTTWLLSAINVKLWMAPLTLITACIVFYVAPNTKVSFKDVWPAAILTGITWEVSNYFFVAAVPFMDFYRLFGPFAIAITWMTWAYFGGMILVLGANLMARQVLTKQIDRMKEALWSFKIESPS